MLAGMRVTDPKSGDVVDYAEPRIRTAVLFSPTVDGSDLASPAKLRFPELGNGDFSHMTVPALVITGDDDHSPMFSERKDWRADAYRLGPSPNFCSG